MSTPYPDPDADLDSYRTSYERVSIISVVSKDALLRDGIASILENEGSFRVISRLADLNLALNEAHDKGVRVIVVDGGNLSESEKALLPSTRAAGIVKTVLIGGSNESACYADLALDRLCDRKELLHAVSDTFAAATLGEDVVSETSAPYLVHLTPREYDVAKLVAQGCSNRVISKRLDIQEQSVKNLVSVIMRKMNCTNRVQVALYLTGQNPNSTEI